MPKFARKFDVNLVSTHVELAESQAEALVDSGWAVALLVCGDAGAELDAGLEPPSV